MTRRVLGVLLLGLGLTSADPSTAAAVDGSAIEVGHGEGTEMARVTVRWNWDRRWDFGRNWLATGFWETGVGFWQGNRDGGRDLWEVGLTPVFRLNSKHSHFFWEAGIGGHLMSQSRMDDRREFGSHFNFGDHVGFGWRLGDHQRYELSYRFQHLSNANTAMPNDTINFHQIRLGFNY